jgi:adenosylhomocysteine nucleosidase
LCGKPDPAILALETGVGLKRMEQALAWVFSQSHSPQLIISAGFSGALRDGINIADIIVATEVVDENGGLWPARWPGEISGHEYQRGKLLTVSRAIAEPGEKLELGRKYDALAVDMETAMVARMCSQRGIAFGCVRAISDDVHTPLSADLDHVIVNGKVSLWRLATRLVRRPWFAGELWRLARHTRLAADRLAVALGRLINVAADF